MISNLRDRRRRKSRDALLRAFADLVQGQPYDQIKVPDIIRRAHVGRSTFYEHFRGKDGLLASSIAGPFAILADSIGPDTDERSLVQLLDHFWVNRALARSLLIGPARQKTIAVLVAQVERRIKSHATSKSGKLLMSRRLIATQVAAVLIAPITAWLLNESRSTPELLARALPRAARALLAASYDRIA